MLAFAMKSALRAALEGIGALHQLRTAAVVPPVGIVGSPVDRTCQ